jgi:Holliday junction resolvasome RuvABC endonuclease subunit
VISAGIDIGSAKYSALAIAENGVPEEVMAWEPDDAKDSDSVRLESFYNWVFFRLKLFRPHAVSVEHVAGFQNRHVIQVLSQFEGVAKLAAKKSGAIVINPPASQSRAAALPVKGNCKKEVAWQAIRKMYPDFDFGRANSGGMDKGDAMTHAIAVPILLERR